MSNRPDLEGIGASLDSGAWDEHDLLELLREVLAYALQVEHTAASHRYMVDEVARLEREVAGLRERLRAIEWDEETDAEQCVWCLGIRIDGHLEGCKFAALLAAAP